MLRLAVAAALAAALLAGPALAFDNTEPLADKQWYITNDQAWSYWPVVPKLYPVKVAVIDTGIDGSHPDLRGRVVLARSFVGGSPYVDSLGHGTFVAGLIAANPSNGYGIAGLAFNAQLLVAKVVDSDGNISVRGEVEAIRWAADNGARVINLSLGGVRDPLDPTLDTYSPLEQAAVEYAYSKGAVVVAALGNGPQSPHTPWNYADYPSALPHVIGVSAVRQDGSVPDYSNRDVVYNDIAAPGAAIFSTIPTNLVDAARPECAARPFSDCGPAELKQGIGTSFAAPQVSAAAALLLGIDPTLRPEQIAWLLERTATDVGATGRDALTGWGTLDISSAADLVDQHLVPVADAYEPNDDAGPWAHSLPPLPRTITATLDFWDDNIDVYRVQLAKGASLFARLTPPVRANVRLALWPPGTENVEPRTVKERLATSPVAKGRRVGRQVRLSYRAKVAGTYYVEAKLVAPVRDPVQYALALSRR